MAMVCAGVDGINTDGVYSELFQVRDIAITGIGHREWVGERGRLGEVAFGSLCRQLTGFLVGDTLDEETSTRGVVEIFTRP